MFQETPNKFTLTQTHRILFLPKEDQGTEISAHSFGVKCDHSYWGSDMSQVMWHVRWTQKGLMPVKPAVHLTNRVSLPAGRALLLKSESSWNIFSLHSLCSHLLPSIRIESKHNCYICSEILITFISLVLSSARCTECLNWKSMHRMNNYRGREIIFRAWLLHPDLPDLGRSWHPLPKHIVLAIFEWFVIHHLVLWQRQKQIRNYSM